MKHNTTPHVLLHTNRCIACGKCVKACPKGILELISMLIHKHVHVKQADLCIGCFKCVKACPQKAILARSGDDIPGIPGRERRISRDLRP